MIPLRTRSVSFAEPAHPTSNHSTSSSQAYASPVASEQSFSVSSLLNLPLRLTEYFALSSGESKVGDSCDESERTGAGEYTRRVSELSALSAFERLLICAQSFSSEHYKNQSAVADWVRFQSVLLEECLAEASSLLVLNAKSRTLKAFYGESQKVASMRRHRIADLFRSEFLRVFRLPSTVIKVSPKTIFSLSFCFFIVFSSLNILASACSRRTARCYRFQSCLSLCREWLSGLSWIFL
jgi:hypothetical protein